MKKAAIATTPTPWLDVLGNQDLMSIILRETRLKDRVWLSETCLLIQTVVAPSFKETADVIKEWGEMALWAAAGEGQLNVVKDCHRVLKFKISEDDAAAAAAGGHLDILRYIAEFEPNHVISSANEASRSGRPDCLRLALDLFSKRKRQLHSDDDEFIDLHGSINLIVGFAGERGDMECLKVQHEFGIKADLFDVKQAVWEGKTDAVEYMVTCMGAPKTTGAVRYAVSSNKLETLRFLLSNGWPMNFHEDSLYRIAKKRGSYEMMECLVAHATGA
jgi:hypothetical protein